MDLPAGLAFATAWAAASVADAATMASGAFNAAVLLVRGRGSHDRGRRNAALVLGTLSTGVAVQAAFAQALYGAQRLGFDVAPFFAPGPWLASRALLLAGSLLLSALILRRNPR